MTEQRRALIRKLKEDPIVQRMASERPKGKKSNYLLPDGYPRAVMMDIANTIYDSNGGEIKERPGSAVAEAIASIWGEWKE